MRKLEFKHQQKLRRASFLEWISQLEVAFSSNLYIKDILSRYSTTNRINSTKDTLMDNLVYTVAYTFVDKVTRSSTSTYKNQGVKLLRVLHTKCAFIDSQTKQRAKYAFSNCKIGPEETAIYFLTRLEQKANEPRNYGVKIILTQLLRDG